MEPRWRYIGQGDLGHIWHDTMHDRYVISDEFGPEGMVPTGAKRGVRVRENTQFQNEVQLS